MNLLSYFLVLNIQINSISGDVNQGEITLTQNGKVFQWSELKTVFIPSISESQRDDFAKAALRRILHHSWNLKIIEDGECSYLKPCKAILLPPNENRSLDPNEELLKTCWFSIESSKVGTSDSHKRYNDIQSLCQSTGFGAYKHLNNYYYLKSQQPWREWIKGWLYKIHHRTLQLKALLGLSTKLPEPQKLKWIEGEETQLSVKTAIKNAKHKIFIATFNLNDPEIYADLITKSKEGVLVRVVYDLQFLFHRDALANLSKLSSAGAEVVPVTVLPHMDSPSHFHPKIYIVDDQIWMGTFNLGKKLGPVNEEGIHFQSSQWSEHLLPLFQYWNDGACEQSVATRSVLSESCPSDIECGPIVRSFEQTCSKPFWKKSFLKNLNFTSPSLTISANGNLTLESMYKLFKRANKQIIIRSVEITFLPLLNFLRSLKKERPELDIQIQLGTGNIRPDLIRVAPELTWLTNKDWSHQKSILIDGKTVFLTSANFSYRGFYYNQEISAFIDPKNY